MKMISGVIITIVGVCIAGFGVSQIIQSLQEPKVEQALSSETEEAGNTPSNTEEDEDRLSNKEKGRAFEEHIVSLFKSEYFEIVEWRGDKITDDGRYATSNQYPDLEIALNLKNGRHLFAVECKYRSKRNDVIEWTYPQQLERYRAYASEREIPVFIALGVGGSPEAPEYLNIIPLEDIDSEYLKPKNLKPYRKKGGDFFYDARNKRLK